MRERHYEHGGAFKPLSVWTTLGYDGTIIATKSHPEDVMPDKLFGLVYRVSELYVGARGSDGTRITKRQRTSANAAGAENPALEHADAAGVAEPAAANAHEASRKSDASDSSNSSSSTSDDKKNKSKEESTHIRRRCGRRQHMLIKRRRNSRTPRGKSSRARRIQTMLLEGLRRRRIVRRGRLNKQR